VTYSRVIPCSTSARSNAGLRKGLYVCLPMTTSPDCGASPGTISAFHVPAMACGGHLRSSLSLGVWASVAYTTVTPAPRAAAISRASGSMIRWARCW